MPRRERPPETTRSEHWLRFAINERPAALNRQISELFGWNDRIEWVSPIKSDGYAEYFDEAFLERLGIADVAVPLSAYWPAGGPRWDGLGRTVSGKVLLVEAKAYVEEAVDYGSRASAKSLQQIGTALKSTKEALAAAADAPWTAPFYQYTNRLAHLHYLRQLNGLDAYLLFIYFANAPDVPRPSSIEEWRGAKRLIEKSLGLQAHHPLSNCLGTLIWDVAEMVSDRG